MNKKLIVLLSFSAVAFGMNNNSNPQLEMKVKQIQAKTWHLQNYMGWVINGSAFGLGIIGFGAFSTKIKAAGLLSISALALPAYSLLDKEYKKQNQQLEALTLKQIK